MNYPKMTKGYSRWGAYMGRPNSIDKKLQDVPLLFHVYELKIDSGGYDAGGAYWGQRPNGIHLYRALSWTHFPSSGPREYCRLAAAKNKDDWQEMFIDAENRAEAKDIVRESFHKARFQC